MERIIIREKDNTFNVETLSSYDVAYVPGFGSSATLFRTPTLVTSKYRFLELFGDRVPSFESSQYYPEATATESGFPTYAIPDFQQLVINADPVMTINDNGQAVFNKDVESGADLEYFFDQVDLQDIEVGKEDWEPTEGVNYFIVEDQGLTYVVTYQVSLSPDTGKTYYETYGDSVYMSNISPKDLHYYEGSRDPALTSDTQIEVESGTIEIKKYYEAARSTPPMFQAGEYDTGYRYALYLLSLGMPVYYEQMNSLEFDEVDLTSDFNSALKNYGITEDESGETVTYISPYVQRWYSYDGNGNYTLCNDPSIHIYTQPEENVWYSGADISVKSMYNGLTKRFMSDPDSPDYSFDSMGDYSIKYITSGGYPTFEYGTLSSDTSGGIQKIDEGLSYAMLELASKRGDSIALIDHTNNPERSIYQNNELSVINRVRERYADFDNSGSSENSEISSILSYGAMFTPWYSCTHSAVGGEYGEIANKFMPASLAFLSALAVQVRNNQTPWLAVSGVSRGKIPYFGSLHTNSLLTNNVADSYQTVPSDLVQDYALISINPITNIRQYGYCIWGNRTLKNNSLGTKATSFLNIRNVVSDVKKRLFEASQQLLFEQNTEILWINFKSLITPLLDTMVSNNILSDYKLTKYNINPESGEPVPAYMVLANIEIRPINSVEVFDLTVQIENNEVEVAEVE